MNIENVIIISVKDFDKKTLWNEDMEKLSSLFKDIYSFSFKLKSDKHEKKKHFFFNENTNVENCINFVYVSSIELEKYYFFI